MISLRDALEETLRGWSEDVNVAWRYSLRNVSLGYEAIDPDLELEPWEPIFPGRLNRAFPGAPKHAHIFRAFDGISPESVRCVVLGQDPYPCPAFSTGRSFEAGNVVNWRELDKMFSKSVRAFMQMVASARTGNSIYSRSFEFWPKLLDDIESGSLEFDSPCDIADRWVDSGVLLLNSSLTISRFEVGMSPHQSQGHLPLWRPLILTVLRLLAFRPTPTAFLCLGGTAWETLEMAGIRNDEIGLKFAVERPHPADARDFLEAANPFVLCNEFLERAGSEPVDW